MLSGPFALRAELLSVALILRPELPPGQLRGATHENIGMIAAFLVLHAQTISVVTRQMAGIEPVIRALGGHAQHNDRRRSRHRIPAQPSRIGSADDWRQVVGS